MRLTDLIEKEDIALTGTAAAREIEITGLTADSRAVEPGYLFAALPGADADGRDFIDQALDRGAAAVLAPPGGRQPATVPFITHQYPRRQFALMAARFFVHQPETIAAVTGTNGKTSVVWFLRQIWETLGHAAAGLGTLGLQAPGIDEAGSLTTPDPVALHERLAGLADAGIAHLAMEASSHGLDQHRLDGVRLRAAAFTNLSRDHLDYHADADSYRNAKLALFSRILDADGRAVINADSPEFEAVAEACRERGQQILTFGRAGVDVRLDDVRATAAGLDVDITIAGRSRTVALPLTGAFQAENAACALALAIACGDDGMAAADALATLVAVPGRVQEVASHRGATIYVDYAHTPDALVHVLTALRPHADGRLIVVFGCGGDRDPGKRAEMGAVAASLANIAVVTDDNPRGEDPAAIRRQILTACPDAREIGDRADAIRCAIADLQAGDLLVIAGKGHERGQIVGATVRPFDDAECVRAAVAEAGS